VPASVLEDGFSVLAVVGVFSLLTKQLGMVNDIANVDRDYSFRK